MDAEVRKLIAEALYDVQVNMPAGQSWNLYSNEACKQIAEKVYDHVSKNIRKGEIWM